MATFSVVGVALRAMLSEQLGANLCRLRLVSKRILASRVFLRHMREPLTVTYRRQNCDRQYQANANNSEYPHLSPLQPRQDLRDFVRHIEAHQKAVTVAVKTESR